MRFMKPIFAITLLFACGLAVTYGLKSSLASDANRVVVAGKPCAAQLKPPVKRTPPVKRIQASTLFRPERTEVIGRLGVPLGTVVRVTGVCVDGTTTRIKEYKGKVLLKIDTVDGVPKAKPSSYPHPGRVGDRELPRPGDRFDYFVHEWGEFTGRVDLPEGVEPAGPEESIGSFRFRLRLRIHPRSE